MSAAALDSFITFGDLLKHLRRRMQLTQQELGIALGYSAAMVARLESGERLPDLGLVKTTYVEALGLQREPELQKRLIELAVASRQPPPASSSETVERTRRETQKIPVPLTSLVGRERDIAAALQLLRRKDVRLVTLLGPPGVGKTRLLIEIARVAADDFRDGVCFVPLAPLADPALVAATLAQALGVAATQTDPLVGVRLHLRDKQMLLALDNFEHLLEAAPLVAAVLDAAPQVKALATSRAALRLSAEFVFEVPPLDEPAAMELFAARAVAVKPGFTLSDENRPDVTAICRRLDGLPLAIELAAARQRLFSPQALLARLEVGGTTAHPALDVLAEGPRDLPQRQRTLRNTVAWSYALLTPDQQRLLRHLSVFAGGCSMAAAQAMAGNPHAFDADLQALLDSSLVQHREGPAGEPRLSLLEMIREYAAEQLAACGEAEPARQWHATYFLDWVIRDAPDAMRRARSPFRLGSADDFVTLVRQLEPEYANLRAALAWSLGDARDPGTGAELATWLAWVWYMRGPWSEAVVWLDRALAQTEGARAAPSPIRARLLLSLAVFVGPVHDPARAVAAAREALATFKALEEGAEIAFALNVLSDVELERNHLAAARRYGEELLALARGLGDPYAAAGALFELGDIALCQKDFARAAALFDESLSGDAGNWGTLNQQGTLACYEGDYDRAAALCGEALAGMRALQWPHAIATALHSLGDIALFQGDAGQARSRFNEGLRLFGENGNKQRAVWCLGGLAATEVVTEHAARAVTLWAAAEAIHAAIGSPRPALRMDDYRECVDVVRGQLGQRELAAAVAAGRAMSFEQTVAYALHGGEADEPPVR